MKIVIENDKATLEDIDTLEVKTGAINFYEISVEFSSEWTGLTKVAIIKNVKEENGVAIPVILDKISLPYLDDSNGYDIGIIGYTLNGETKTLQISTNLVSFWVKEGAGSITVEEREVPETDIWEQYVATMNGILEDTVEVKEAIEGICTEIEGYRDETKGYRDETEGFKNTTEQAIEEGFEMLGGLANDFVGLTEEATTDFNNNAISKTEAFDLNATEKTNIVNQIKDDVEDLKDETLGYKNDAKGSADKAKVSEDNAKDSEEDAELALSDLLAMLGTSVATLTGGKLTPSQIPDLSINDVFPVADTDEMLELTAQRGDVAIIVVENVVTDTYMLSADDPTVLSNWKKLGVSYVANAGHSTTADNATDSEKINGKRIVGMTETQYASAVLDENTYYMVYPD